MPVQAPPPDASPAQLRAFFASDAYRALPGKEQRELRAQMRAATAEVSAKAAAAAREANQQVSQSAVDLVAWKHSPEALALPVAERDRIYRERRAELERQHGRGR